MDLAFSDDDLAFREDVRTFVAENLPEDIAESARRGRPISKPDIQRWQRILYDQGWAAPAWPAEYGGTGWDATKRYIFDEVMAEFDTPETIPFGLLMVGPLIYTFGNDAQKPGLFGTGRRL
jgi:alkylation response protein AidB-like acyl-CoA dehydrogenase